MEWSSCLSIMIGVVEERIVDLLRRKNPLYERKGKKEVRVRMEVVCITGSTYVLL